MQALRVVATVLSAIIVQLGFAPVAWSQDAGVPRGASFVDSVQCLAAGASPSDGAICCSDFESFPTPTSIDEALAILPKVLGDKRVRRITRFDTKYFGSGLGVILRNAWKLRRTDSALGNWFRQRGIPDQDDMAGIILESFHRQLNGLPIDVPAQIDTIRGLEFDYRPTQAKLYQAGQQSNHTLFAVLPYSDQGWVDVEGDHVPHENDCFLPLIKQARPAIKACWRAMPDTRGIGAIWRHIDDAGHVLFEKKSGASQDTWVEIQTDVHGRVIRSEVVPGAHAWDDESHPPERIPSKTAACLARSLEGVSLPSHPNATYTLDFGLYRHRAH